MEALDLTFEFHHLGEQISWLLQHQDKRIHELEMSVQRLEKKAKANAEHD